MLAHPVSYQYLFFPLLHCWQPAFSSILAAIVSVRAYVPLSSIHPLHSLSWDWTLEIQSWAAHSSALRELTIYERKEKRDFYTLTELNDYKGAMKNIEFASDLWYTQYPVYLMEGRREGVLWSLEVRKRFILGWCKILSWVWRQNDGRTVLLKYFERGESKSPLLSHKIQSCHPVFSSLICSSLYFLLLQVTGLYCCPSTWVMRLPKLKIS